MRDHGDGQPSWPGDGPPAGPGAGLGRWLADHRRAAGLTQRELAAAAGVGLGTVRDVEQGRRTRSRSVDRLAGASGWTPSRPAAQPRPGRYAPEPRARMLGRPPELARTCGCGCSGR